NKLALKSGWDEAKLAIVFQDLMKVDFNVCLTGFEMGEIDSLIMATEDDAGGDDDDDIELPRNGAAVSREGDLWFLGESRLLCGDARDPASYEALLDGEKAELVATDPPYNVQVQGHVSGLGKVQHREFAMASGEMSEAEF